MKTKYECIAYKNNEIVYRTYITSENKEIALSEFGILLKKRGINYSYVKANF